MSSFKQKFRRSPIFGPLNRLWQKIVWNKWVRKGKPVPPPHEVKQLIIQEFARNFGLSTLIETGTYRGKMIMAMRKNFDRIFSIELDETLAHRAQTLFCNDPHVTIVQGDSASKIRDVLENIRQPVLFWLDGHFSGGETAQDEKDTPIMEELTAIFSHPVSGHVILIDDAILFNGTNDYPTIDKLREIVAKQPDKYGLELEANIIRIFQKS